MPRTIHLLTATLLCLALAMALPIRAEPIAIAVSVPPQAYFVSRIGAQRVRVQVMIPPGNSPETYAPTPRQMVLLGRARLYVKVGHPAFLFEDRYIAPFLESNPGVQVVNMSAGVDYLEDSGAEGTHAEHDSGEGDPHVWVSPDTVEVAARNIAQALIGLDPANESLYRANLARFLSDVERLDTEIRGLLAGLKNRRFLVYHPAWGYFARHYGLEQVAVESGGKEPSPAALAATIERARREGIKVIFVQRGFSRKSAEVIAREIGGAVVEVDPLAYDWLANLRKVAQAFREALNRG